MCMCLGKANQINEIGFNVLSHRRCRPPLDCFHCCVKRSWRFLTFCSALLFFPWISGCISASRQLSVTSHTRLMQPCHRLMLPTWNGSFETGVYQCCNVCVTPHPQTPHWRWQLAFELILYFHFVFWWLWGAVLLCFCDERRCTLLLWLRSFFFFHFGSTRPSFRLFFFFFPSHASMPPDCH